MDDGFQIFEKSHHILRKNFKDAFILVENGYLDYAAVFSESFRDASYVTGSFSPETAASAFFIGRAANRAIDRIGMAGVLKSIEAEAANHAVSECAFFHPLMQGSGKQRKKRHQQEGTP